VEEFEGETLREMRERVRVTGRVRVNDDAL
jgi:hypothetical protein